MLAFNVAGMAAVGAEIGGRLSERMSGQWTQTSRTALGVVVPGAIIVFLWAIGGCFGFFGGMVRSSARFLWRGCYSGKDVESWCAVNGPGVHTVIDARSYRWARECR